MEQTMNGLYYREQLKKAKALYSKGEITIDDLYAVADAYIVYLKEYKRKSGKKLTIPNRAYLIRAI